MRHEWDEEMGEISGFGGSYEGGCRAMVLAGMEWFDDHPDANPVFKGFQGVYGLIDEDNDDARALTEAIMSAKVIRDDGTESTARQESTGAMHHASVMHSLAYRKLGWEQYRKQMCERQKEEEEKGDTAKRSGEEDFGLGGATEKGVGEGQGEGDSEG